MIHNRVAVAVVIVLLSASCTLVVSLESGRKGAFKLLNDYLVEHEESSDLGKNIEAAKKYLEEPENNPEVLELVELFRNIDAKDVCGAANVAGKREFIRALKDKEPGLYRGRTAMTRLGTLVYDCVQEATEICFDLFERQWLGNWTKIETDLKELGDSHIFKEVDGINKIAAPVQSINVRLEALLLKVALDDYFNNGEFDLMAEISKGKGTLLAGIRDEVRAKMTTIDPELVERVREKIRKETYEPCKIFVDQEQSKSILDPVGQLSDLIELTQLAFKPIEGDTVQTFLWASRYYRCKASTKRSLDEEVERNVKIIEQLIAD